MGSSTTDMTPELQTLCTKIGLDASFKDWCEKNEILDVEAFGSLAAEEEMVETKIVDKPFPKIIEDKAISITVKITELWRACRNAIDTEEKSKKSGSNSDLEVPLDDATKEALETTWLNRHNFNLSDSWLLTENIIGKLISRG